MMWHNSISLLVESHVVLNRIKSKFDTVCYVRLGFDPQKWQPCRTVFYFIEAKNKYGRLLSQKCKMKLIFQGNFSRKPIDFWHFVVKKKTFMKNWTSFLRQRSQVLWSKILQRIEFLRNSFKSKDLKTVHLTHNSLDSSRKYIQFTSLQFKTNLSEITAWYNFNASF